MRCHDVTNWMDESSGSFMLLFSHSFSFSGVKSIQPPFMTPSNVPAFIAFVRQSAAIFSVQIQWSRVVPSTGSRSVINGSPVSSLSSPNLLAYASEVNGEAFVAHRMQAALVDILLQRTAVRVELCWASAMENCQVSGQDQFQIVVEAAPPSGRWIQIDLCPSHPLGSAACGLLEVLASPIEPCASTA